VSEAHELNCTAFSMVGKSSKASMQNYPVVSEFAVAARYMLRAVPAAI
jgi:hypothetical protein